jgi:DNA transposition AAA+ family ATPase
MTTATTSENSPASQQAEASSAHARINIPLNLENWKSLAPDVQAELLWFHQHLLDEGLDWKSACEALGYDRSVLFRVLKGTYEGSWKNVVSAVLSYRKILSERTLIQRTEFAENSISRLVWGGLDYAVANNSITLIEGESGIGKSVSGRKWKEDNNHGRSVYVIAPVIGGAKALLREICAAIGANKNQNVPQMLESIRRAFNKNRILIVDEAQRLLPTDRRSSPVMVEYLRDLHDRTGCALAFIATSRLSEQLKKMEYQFEQVLGRIGMPVRLPRKLSEKDFAPVIRQYVKVPSARLLSTCEAIVNARVLDGDGANDLGRMRVLGEILKMASRIAAKDRAAQGVCADEHVFKAIALRKQMMGEQKFAA